jgi:hypothetical protein
MRSVHAIVTCRVVLHIRGQLVKDDIVLGDVENFSATFTLAGVTIETVRFIGFGNEFESNADAEVN